MVKQIILPLALVAVFIIAVGLFVKNSSKLNIPGSVNSLENSSQKVITIHGKTINVEIADTSAARAKGLSGRTSLETNSGMLFTFEKMDSTPVFWMKDMLIPIDIIWINDGKIVKIDQSVSAPSPGTSDSQLTKYPSGQPVDYVLEVNSGYCKENSINVGEPVSLPAL